MNITPITPITRLDGISDLSKIEQTGAANGEGSLFKGVFADALQNVIDTDNKVAEDVQALVTGETDSLHELLIDQTKAQLSIELMVQLRNKLLDAYNELMRINI